MANIIITLDEMKAKMSEQAFARAFYKDRNAAKNEEFAQQCLDDAIAEATAMLRQHGAYEDIPSEMASHALIVRMVCDLAYANAISYYPDASSESSPPARFRERARQTAQAIVSDKMRPGGSGGRPRPVFLPDENLTPLGTSRSPYTDTANGNKIGGF